MCASETRRRKTVAGWTLLGIMLTTQASLADTVSTSFENLGAGDFTIGASPISATFAGGTAQTVGNLAFYRTGLFSWHVASGVTATVTFETAASEVNFWFRDTPNGGPVEVRVIDEGGVVVGQATGTQSFQNLTVTRMVGETLIASVEVENPGAQDIVVDDFEFTADVAVGGGPIDDPIPAAIPQGSTEIQLIDTVSGLTAPVWAEAV